MEANTASPDTVTARSTMREVLETFPGAQRALFRKYHIGGCSQCSFQPSETLAQLCQRNNQLEVEEVLAHIRASHQQDEAIFISPQELLRLWNEDSSLKLLDIRSRPEYEAVHIEGAVLLSQPTMQEIMRSWPRDQMLVIVDHRGRSALDAAAYFMGHGFEKVRCLRGGIDAWSQEVDPKIRRYRLA